MTQHTKTKTTDAESITATPATLDASDAYGEAVAVRCEQNAATDDAKTAARLLKKYAGGALSVRVSAEDFSESIAPHFNIGAASCPVSRAARSKDGEAVSVGVIPSALFAAVAKTRGEGEGIDAGRAFRRVLARLTGNAGALAHFNADTAKAAEKTPRAVFEALRAQSIAL